ncbi:MAG: Extracellular nuclease [Parcubacteria group bacterium Gr01-1014_107]|nr:MAG: Extracellular nuclease [Parcubacteria group bacterium Gr01-1014_107]
MEILEKIKSFFRESGSREKALTVAIIFLVGSASFGLGRLSVLESKKEPVRIENLPLQAKISGGANVKKELPLADGQVEEGQAQTLPAGGMLVGSKNSDKYHFPWCSGAKRIKEENKVYFASAEEARASGYTPASNCKGLE